MKIIFSPSKTQYIQKVSPQKNLSGSRVLFQDSTRQLIQKIQQYSLEELQDILKVSEERARSFFGGYQNFERQPESHAITSFSGTSFGHLETSLFTQADWKFTQEYVRILSGLYGILKPLDLMREYRLDMGDKIFGDNDGYKNLYDFWKEKVEKYFEKEDLILNLASSEYSKMLSIKQRAQMVTVDFLVKKEGKMKAVSVFSKQQRGKMLNWIIRNKIKEIENISQYKSDGFVFNKKLSDQKKKVFLKNEKG